MFNPFALCQMVMISRFELTVKLIGKKDNTISSDQCCFYEEANLLFYLINL